MKFTCDRSVLQKEISMAQEIITTKNAMSILSNIYLEAADNTLVIKATDTKVYFETQLPVTVIESGSTTVLGEKFSGILGSIPEGDLEIEKIDSKIIIKPTVTSTKKNIKFQLKSISSEKFPEFPVSSGDFFDLPVKDFKDMVSQTVFAISDDETRYFMNGVLLEKTDDKIVMVATDGRRLAYINKSAGAEIHNFEGIIVPPKILSLLLKRAGDEGLVSLSVNDTTLFMHFGSYKFSTVLIEGQFPNYRKVIPESQPYSFSVNRFEMLDALRRVSLLVEQKSRRVYLDVAPGVVSIYSEENDIGVAREEIPCKYEGEEVSIALNYRYIEEPFKSMTDDEICVRFTNSSKALTIVPIPERDFFHIVMPMQN